MSEKKGTLVAQGLLRSFGRVASRMSVEKQDALDARIAPYELPIFAAAENGKNDFQDIDIDACFPDLKGPLVVEVGIGNGEHVFFHAQHYPDKRHIGAEVYKNGLLNLVVQMEEVAEAG